MARFPLRPPSRLATFALLALCGAWLARAAWALRLSPSPDYAVVVDMARDMAAGERFPVFFYGQAYMGSLEPAASALLCAVFGFSPFAVCLGTAIVAWLACGAIAFFARRVAGWTAAAASLLLLLPGAWYWVHFSASPRGGYALAVLLAVLGCGIAGTSRLAGPPAGGAAGRGRVRPGPAAAFGFVCGLALWNNLLAAPALLAAGAVLAVRLRTGLLSHRFWLPFGLAFLAGSAPWLGWNAANGWVGLSFAPGLPPTGIRHALRVLTGPVLREFLGLTRYRSAAADALPALLALAGAGAAGGLVAARRRPVFALGAATVLHAALFVAFWGKTSFGTTASARYLLPVYATSVLLAGPGLVALASDGGRLRRWTAGVFAGAVLLAIAALQASVTLPVSNRMEAEFGLGSERTRADAALVSGPVYADYHLECFHWMSDRAVVPVSTRLCRETWRLPALEAADAPAVFNGFSEIGRFLSASGGSGRLVRGRRVEILTGFSPPPPAAERMAAAPALTGADGADLSSALLDSDLATAARPAAAPDGTFPVDVSFPAPAASCGIVLAFAPDPAIAGVRVEDVAEDGSRTALADLARHWGWHWSGPRPWIGGTSERVELRWAPRSVERLRISLLVRPGLVPPRIALLRFLEPADLPPPDPDAVRDALARLPDGNGPLRFVGDRWLRARLGNEPEPSLSLRHLVLGNCNLPGWDRHTRIDPAENTAVAVPAGQRTEARRLLEETGLAFGETDVGGTVLFHLPGTDPAPPFFRTAALRFAHGRLAVESGPADAAPPPREAARETD